MMKNRIDLAVLATLSALLCATAAQVLDTRQPPPGAPRHNEEVSIELETTQQSGAQRQIEERQIKQLRQITDEQQGHALVANTRLHAMLGQPGPTHTSGQALIIRTRDLDPESQSQLEEDLQVMSRIVEKAAQSEPVRGPRAMGIDLVFGPGGSPVRTLYLEGYGALFMVRANFPLLPLPVTAKPSAEDATPKAPSTWEQTRAELYGTPAAPEPILPLGWISEAPESLEFDAAKVDRLRQNLIEAIKQASNIRQLAAEDSVTICVQGAPASPVIQVRRESSVDPDGRIGSVEFRTRRNVVAGEKEPYRAVLTLQARKADIDRFARGEITLAQFRELARTQTYPGGRGWNSPNALFWSNP